PPHPVQLSRRPRVRAHGPAARVAQLLQSGSELGVCIDRRGEAVSQTRDLSQGWTLGWMAEPTLGRWKQRFGDWTVIQGALVGESPDFAQILAHPEPQQDHQWSCRVRIDTPDTAFSVMVCFDEGRNSYYQIRMKPGEKIRANYVLSDGFDGELMAPCGPDIEAETEYD